MNLEEARVEVDWSEREARRAAEDEIVRARLKAGRGLWITARGGSMWPFIRDGDVVHLVRRPRYRPGDVVLLDRGALGPLHRILWRGRSGGLCIKGDAARSVDGIYQPEDVLAAVTAIARGGRGVFVHRHVPRLYSALMGLRVRIRGDAPG